jgi:transcriptional regulator with XRE-family HTH domain
MNKKRKTGLNRIKAVIKSQGRNELWVAQQIGISKTSLSNYCAFLREPPLDVLFRISALLNVPVTDLINLEAKIETEAMKKKAGKSPKGEKANND